MKLPIGLPTIMLPVIVLVILCGCTAVNPQTIIIATPEPTGTPTIAIPAPTPTVPEVTPESFPVTIITPSPEPTPIPTTPVPTPEPTRVFSPIGTPTPIPLETMNVDEPYVRYTDDTFSIDMPSNWSVRTDIIPFEQTQINHLSSVKMDTERFILSGSDPAINLTILVDTLFTGGTAKPSYDFARFANTITTTIPDVDGVRAISNFRTKYSLKYRTPIIQFDVRIPESSTSYPLWYTEWNSYSYNHLYTVRFNTPDSLEDYTNIRDRVLDSLEVEEAIKVST